MMVLTNQKLFLNDYLSCENHDFLPSGFVPTSKIGMNFFDMHLPVADGDKLRAASFRRYVWTVSSLAILSQLPSYVRPEVLELSDLYFRTETQTTIGHTNGICYFFCKSKYDSIGNYLG
jgi:hypothetical protein